MRPSTSPARTARDRRRDREQGGVAGQVSEIVVDLLEMVGVDDQQRAAVGPAARPVESGKEGLAVQHPGHGVAARPLLQAPVGRGKLGMGPRQIAVGGPQLLALPEGEGAGRPGYRQRADGEHQPGIAVDDASQRRDKRERKQEGCKEGREGNRGRFQKDPIHAALLVRAAEWQQAREGALSGHVKILPDPSFRHVFAHKNIGCRHVPRTRICDIRAV